MKNKIKVIHLGYSDNYGGASIAMNRINDALSLVGTIDSKMATVTASINPEVICLNSTFIDKIFAYFRVRIAYKTVQFLQKTSNQSGRSINYFPSTVSARLATLEFDVLHLHWIGNETIRLEDLAKIKKPIVWTFHDNWPLLGAEHTDIDDSIRFIEGYSASNRDELTRGIDIDSWTWKRKKNVFKKVKIQPVVVSSWLAEQTKKSYLWKNSIPEIIHNPIKIESWTVLEKKKCREQLNLSEHNKVIVFGAVNGFTDELKGYRNLEKAVHVLSTILPKDNFTLLVFGDADIKEIRLSETVILKSVGKIDDFRLLNTIYCSADVVAVPSYIETFGQVAVEAISCGVPVVAFQTSGLIDIIRDDFNGFLCSPFKVEDMAHKLHLTFSSLWDSEKMRRDINSRFGYLTVAKKYELLYEKILKNNNEFI
jgi:glycosyltransferase involved in cell wall biosynthesis